MKRMCGYLKVAVGIVLLAVVAAVLSTADSRTVQAAGTAPVEVRNIPLPVTLSAPGQISGSVSATQDGPWNVAVTSLPAVQLAPGSTVTVSENSTTHPYVIELCTGCPPDGKSATLPVGYRFVIEQVSGLCTVSLDSQVLLSPRISASLNGQVRRYYVNSQAHGHHQRVFNDQTRIYVDGGVLEGLSIASLGNESCDVTFSGELTALSDPFPQAP